MSNRHLMSGGRYPVLRALALIYMVGACFAVLAGIAWMIYSIIESHANSLARAIVSLEILAATFFVAISMLAIAEVLKLFMDIEHNSRIVALSSASSNGNAVATTNRLMQLDEETAEGALIRGR